jgi:hypothetical protein
MESLLNTSLNDDEVDYLNKLGNFYKTSNSNDVDNSLDLDTTTNLSCMTTLQDDIDFGFDDSYDILNKSV